MGSAASRPASRMCEPHDGGKAVAVGRSKSACRQPRAESAGLSVSLPESKLKRANKSHNDLFGTVAGADDMHKMTSYDKEMLWSTWRDMTAANGHLVELAYERILDDWPALRVVFDSGPEQRAVGDRRLRRQAGAMHAFLSQAVETLRDCGADAVTKSAEELGARHVSLYRSGVGRALVDEQRKATAAGKRPDLQIKRLAEAGRAGRTSSDSGSAVSDGPNAPPPPPPPPSNIIDAYWLAFNKHILQEIRASLSHHDVEWREHSYLVWVNFMQPLVCAVRNGYDCEMRRRTQTQKRCGSKAKCAARQ